MCYLSSAWVGTLCHCSAHRGRHNADLPFGGYAGFSAVLQLSGVVLSLPLQKGELFSLPMRLQKAHTASTPFLHGTVPPCGGAWLATELTCFNSTVPEVGGDIEGLGGMTPTPRPSKAALGLQAHNTVRCKPLHRCDSRNANLFVVFISVQCIKVNPLQV